MLLRRVSASPLVSLSLSRVATCLPSRLTIPSNSYSSFTISPVPPFSNAKVLCVPIPAHALPRRHYSAQTSQSLIETAAKHINTILTTSIKPTKDAILLFDKQCGLSDTLAQAYTAAFEQFFGASGRKFEVIDFDKTTPEDILNKFGLLTEGN